MRRRFSTILVAALLAACGGPPPAQAPFVPGHDPNVAVFESDRQSSWDQFRLGDGLNVVVSNAQVPAAPAWRFSARDGFSSSPSVAGTTVYLASNDQRLYALDAGTGKLLRSYKADSQLMSQPVYANGTLYVGAGDSEGTIWAPPFYKLIGAGNNDLVALDMQTFKQVWKVRLPGSAMPTPALVGPMLVHTDAAGMVYAFDAKTGAYVWRYVLASDSDMSQVLHVRDRLFVAGGYPNVVVALRPDGTQIWRTRFDTYDGAFSDCPLAADGRAVFGMYVRQLPPVHRPWVPDGYPAEQHVYALDQRDGRVLWDRLLPHVTGIIPKRNESAIPLVYAGTLYDGSAIAPVVSALSPLTGTVKWQVKVDGPVKGGIAARDGVLYFGDLAGTLWAVSASTGLPLGSIKTDVKFNVGSPIILNDSLIVGAAGGAALAVPLDAIRNSRAIPGVTTAAPDRSWLIWLAALAVLVLLAANAARVNARRSRR